MSRNMTVAEASRIENPVTSAASGMKSGSAAQKVERVSGMTIRLSGRTTAEHHEHRHEVRGDDGERQQLPGKAHLLDEARVAEKARARHLDGGLEEHPGHEPGEHEQRVVLDRDGPQQDREEQPVAEHQHDRVDERPHQPERGTPVFDAQLTAEEVEKEVAVTEKVGVELHGLPV